MKISVKKKEIKYGSDLSGDPVYDYLKTEVLTGHELLGGEIRVPTRFAHGSPRKFLKVWVMDQKTKKITPYEYPYNKILRGIE